MARKPKIPKQPTTTNDSKVVSSADAATTPNLEVGKKIPVNPEYNRMRVARRFWRNSYGAGFHFPYILDANNAPVLFPYTGEAVADPNKDNGNYAKRRSRSYVGPLVQSIVDRYIGFICRQEPARPTGEDWYTEFLVDVDGDDCTLSELMEAAVKRALIEKKVFILVNTTASEMFTTAMDAKDVKARLQLVCADLVPYAKYKYDKLVECIMLDEDDYDVNNLQQSFVSKIFNGWYMNAEFIQQVTVERSFNMTYQQSKTAEYTITGLGPREENVYGQLPLIEVTTGSSMVEHIAEAQKQIYNLLSGRDSIIYDTTFNQFIITGINDSNTNDIKRGTEGILCLPAGADAKYVAPPPETIQTLQEVIQSHMDWIHEYAGVGKQEQNQLESGLSKAFNQDELAVKIVKFRKVLEKAENRIVKCVSAGLDQEYPGPARYPVDITMPEMVEDLRKVIQMSCPIPPVLKASFLKQFAGAHFKLNEQEQTMLDSQLKEVQAQPLDNPNVDPEAQSNDEDGEEGEAPTKPKPAKSSKLVGEGSEAGKKLDSIGGKN